jgi:hypothetical protein
VVNWLTNRPRVGLDVTDVMALVDGFDYLTSLLLKVHEKSPPESLSQYGLDYEDVKMIIHHENDTY